MVAVISSKHFTQITRSPLLAEEHSVVAGQNYLVVQIDRHHIPSEPLFWPSCVVVGLLGHNVTLDAAADYPVDVLSPPGASLTNLLHNINRHPVAATTLVQLLRKQSCMSIDQGLFAESLAYSVLQQSQEFQTWLTTNATRSHAIQSTPPVIVTRKTHDDGDELTLTLNRPLVHNAYNSDMKDHLCAALCVANLDPDITHVHLNAAGHSFSAGGDLTEFGASPNPAVAHLSRTTRSAAGLLASLSISTSSALQGACIGAGIELPAFTDRVTASPDTFFQLPEVAMGLIPGAGGTVSLPRRIGRQRTAWLALTNTRIDTATALKWGLIDALVD
jgi:enoyl-CoA hydratase/carnithine racemase